jgi:vitamin K-dependent gamma-carboxylase-like protein
VNRAMARLLAPQPIERLALLRMVVPLAVLGFLSSRLVHADDWIGRAGFHVPDLGGHDWRQPLYLAPVPAWAAWTVAALIVVAGLSLAAGFHVRAAAATFAALVAYVVLADRLEAFTVSKVAPVLTLALLLAPSGARYALDARNGPSPATAPAGVVRFFQVFLLVMYCGAGVAKLRGDWLSADVLWSHLHDTYQTPIAWWLLHTLPAWSWRALQGLTLLFEVGAPLWFTLPWTRLPALFVGLGMHAMIGLMFGPVVWFALLMSGMLFACYAPERWLLRLFRRYRPPGTAASPT